MYKAISDRIIIKFEENEKTQLINNEDFPFHDRGVVIGVGDKVKSVKVGDHVIFHLFDEIALPGVDLAVIREKSVLAKIE